MVTHDEPGALTFHYSYDLSIVYWSDMFKRV